MRGLLRLRQRRSEHGPLPECAANHISTARPFADMMHSQDPHLAKGPEQLVQRAEVRQSSCLTCVHTACRPAHRSAHVSTSTHAMATNQQPTNQPTNQHSAVACADLVSTVCDLVSTVRDLVSTVCSVQCDLASTVCYVCACETSGLRDRRSQTAVTVLR